PCPAIPAGTCAGGGSTTSPGTLSGTGCGARCRSSTPATCCWPGSAWSSWPSPTSTCGWWPAVLSATRGWCSSVAEHETHEFDVVVIGAGGAGLRAAIEARDRGARTALVCKSLLGKAHTVMAEGGIAAAMGNVYPDDNWRVHFRDTMRGGKLLNSGRTAQLPTPRGPPPGGRSGRRGGRCSTPPTPAASPSALSAATASPAWPTSATAPAW